MILNAQKFNYLILFLVGTIILTACSINNKVDKVTSNQSSFSKDSYAGLKINDKASSYKLDEIEDSRINECYFANNGLETDVQFQIINDKISVISTKDINISSYTDINVGEDEEKIYAKHESKLLQQIKNPYGESGDYALILWNDASKKVGTRYDVEDKVITSISIGNENLTLMEGCA
ncbi:hypothetical protein [Acinetobacter sp. KS-LM10]|uniref:hypothetical protein n=1 Tax=Acinetobacter sp. KS-LM10 TaxID=3120518 RepID=UPI0030D5EA20